MLRPVFMVYVDGCREAKQKRKRDSDLPDRVGKRQSANGSLPDGAREASPHGHDSRASPVPDAAADKGQTQQWGASWGHRPSAPGALRPEPVLNVDKHKRATQGKWGNSAEEPFSNGPSGSNKSGHQLVSTSLQSAATRSSKDNPLDASRIGHGHKTVSPSHDAGSMDAVPMSDALADGQVAGGTHDLNRMVEHLAGHLPGSADDDDDDDAEAGDQEATDDEDTDSDGKQSQLDIDVVN